MSIVKECGSSIIKLGKCEKIDCTERTIRRSLNEGKMTPCFLDQIAKYLDVDPRLLSGELHKQAESYDDNFLKTISLAQLKAEKHPYYKECRNYSFLHLNSFVSPIFTYRRLYITIIQPERRFFKYFKYFHTHKYKNRYLML